MELLCLILSLLIYCGTERSDIKHLSDLEAKQINFVPLVCSINDFLRGDTLTLPRNFRSLKIKRLPSEKQVYSVTGYIKFFQLEEDNDYHLVICDSNYNMKFIAEIPSPLCRESLLSGYSSHYAACRHLLDSLYILQNQNKHWINRKIKFLISGVAFHDFVHGQLGRAKRGLELHPVINLSVLP